ncbi:sigma 54-interacting transcriptional regulator [Clostridium ganghwense]|uniref:Sigma 54-interacting transcriptional regulator n=1 Tax=Clostridium ganghwense TaxID=312089 RepID=A0ABT4CKW9_9CLOT|nr:sigma 54-interacting transcriptional regulator [Clostridium ganghwense]MCY6369690.1 sigma 54-interacting transcriptional regulator [Clostridium ganghwense]
MGIDNFTDYTSKKLDTILQNIYVGVIETDKESKIINYNKKAESVLGIKSQKVLGKYAFELFPELNIRECLKRGKKIEKEQIQVNGKIISITKIPIKQYEEIVGCITLIRDDTKYNTLIGELKNEKDISEVLETVLEMTYDGIVFVDKYGHIKMISEVYAEFLGIDKDEAVGKHVKEVIENTRMHIVAKTGIRETVDFQKVKGRYIIANRIPIIKHGEIQGAVGQLLFRNLKSFDSFSKRVTRIEKKIKRYGENLHENNSAAYSFGNIIGNSEIMDKTKEFAKKAARTTSNVLLIGESGTGKELFAHAIHKDSDRAYGNFVKVNCAAIPAELLESELFGYEKGAFTGANREGKIGKFELADGGTIFLDEIGDMPLAMQVKLLRVIQEKEVERIGADYTKNIDIRIIAATNRCLEKMIKEGKFRKDLYYRLNVLTIKIPSLRERKDDIEILIDFLIGKIGEKLNKYIKGISPEAVECMKNYSWEGNIRQLENVIERAMNIVNYGEKILMEHLPREIIGTNNVIKKIYKLDDVINKAEKEAILNALAACKGNKSKVAKLLQISRTTLYEKMNKHNILG